MGSPGFSATSGAVRKSDLISQDKQEKSQSALPFVKMHGLGNDFVMVNLPDLMAVDSLRSAFERGFDPLPELAGKLCDRHYGVGADGLIVGFSLAAVRAKPSSALAHAHQLIVKVGYGCPDDGRCDIGWTYLNGDGSFSAMCGNGLRCLSLWAIEVKLVATSHFLVSTKVGAVEVDLKSNDRITVDIGIPNLTSHSIPLSGVTSDRFIKQPVGTGTDRFNGTCVNMGNPHCVIFLDGKESTMLKNHLDFPAHLVAPAKLIQELPLFPEGVNVEFAVADGREAVRTWVWERGCGPTLACASGAAAVLVAGVLEGRLDRACEVRLPGGSLEINWDAGDEHVRITGPARTSFAGVVDLEDFGFVVSEKPDAECGLKEAGCR